MQHSFFAQSQNDTIEILCCDNTISWYSHIQGKQIRLEHTTLDIVRREVKYLNPFYFDRSVKGVKDAANTFLGLVYQELCGIATPQEKYDALSQDWDRHTKGQIQVD